MINCYFIRLVLTQKKKKKIFNLEEFYELAHLELNPFSSVLYR